MIIVTGAAGFIGKQLVRYLLGRTQHTIVGLDNLHHGDWRESPSSERLSLIKGDVRDTDLLRRVFPEAEVVFHLAAQAHVMESVRDPDYTFSSNVIGTFSVLQAAREAGVKHVVFTSSREVYGEPEQLPVPETSPLVPKNPYGASKIAGEAYCRLFNGGSVRVSIVRLANVYGPGDHDRVVPIFIERALRGLPLVIHGGRQVIDFVSVGTVVEALWQVACRPTGEPINIGSGMGVTLPELATRIIRETGSQSKVEIGPAHEEEVVQFVADVSRMHSDLGIGPPSDPLFELPAQLGWDQARVSVPVASEDAR